MQVNRLPKTNLHLSQISLGTMTFGDQTNRRDSFAIMDYAVENGVNVLDTANIYNKGESERIVGAWLKERNARRNVILATKVFGQMTENPNDGGLSRYNIHRAADESLKRLQTDVIDIYYLHSPDPHTELEESLYALDLLIRAGKIRYAAVSNYAAWQIADIMAVCDKRGYSAPVLTQNVYNLITRGIEAELTPFLKKHQMGLTVYNPIAAGLLAGKHRPGKPAENTRFSKSSTYYDRYWSDENFAAIDKLAAIAEANGISLLSLAMKWCAAQPEVTSVITGVSRLEHLKQNLAATDGDGLSAEIMAACDDVWRSLAGTRFAYYR